MALRVLTTDEQGGMERGDGGEGGGVAWSEWHWYSSTSGVSTFLNIFIDARLDVWIDTCHFHGLLVLCLYIHTFMKKFSFMHVI
jgi:hypothetical protein